MLPGSSTDVPANPVELQRLASLEVLSFAATKHGCHWRGCKTQKQEKEKKKSINKFTLPISNAHQQLTSDQSRWTNSLFVGSKSATPVPPPSDSVVGHVDAPWTRTNKHSMDRTFDRRTANDIGLASRLSLNPRCDRPSTHHYCGPLSIADLLH